MSIDDTIPIARVVPGAPPPAPPRRSWWARNRVKVLVGAIVVILVPIAVVAVGLFQAVRSAADIEQAAVGTCAQQIDETSYMPIDCGDPKATHTILAQLPHGRDCATVDGATEEASNAADDSSTTCLGPRGVDPATSMNGVKTGDCVTKDYQQRRPCDSPEAAGKVVRRLDGVTKADAATACDQVPDADISIDQASTQSSSVGGLGTGTTEGDHTVLCVQSLR